MATERQVFVIRELLAGTSTNEIVAKATSGHAEPVHVETEDGTIIAHRDKTGEAAARNLVRSTRAVLNALAEMGMCSPIPKAERVKLSDEERKERAAARREAKKAERDAERAELEALRAKLAEQEG